MALKSLGNAETIWAGEDVREGWLSGTWAGVSLEAKKNQDKGQEHTRTGGISESTPLDQYWGAGMAIASHRFSSMGVSGDYDVILVGDWNWTESTWVLPHQLPSPLLSLPPSAVLESPAVHIAHCFPKNQHLDLFMRCFHFNLFLSFLCLLWFCLFVFVLSNCLSLVNHLCFHVSGGLILRLWNHLLVQLWLHHSALEMLFSFWPVLKFLFFLTDVLWFLTPHSPTLFALGDLKEFIKSLGADFILFCGFFWCVFMCICTSVCTCMWQLQGNIMCLPQLLFTLLFERRSLTEPSSLIWLDWMASRSRNPPTCLLSAGITGACHST